MSAPSEPKKLDAAPVVEVDGLELLRENDGEICYAPRRVTSPALERFRKALQWLIDNGYVEWHDISGEQDTQWLYTPTEKAVAYLKSHGEQR